MSGKRTKALRRNMESSASFNDMRGQDKIRTSIMYKKVWRKIKRSYLCQTI